MDDSAFHRALEAIWRLLSEINGYVVAREPWKVLKEEGKSPRLSRILYAAAEGVRFAAALLFPFTPSTSRRIFAALGAPTADPTLADLEWGRLPTGATLAPAEALFPRVDTAAYFSREESKPMSTDTPDAPSTATSTHLPSSASTTGRPAAASISMNRTLEAIGPVSPSCST